MRFMHSNLTARHILKKLLLVLSCALASGAGAQTTWPDKAVTIVVPFPAGGSTDMVARAMALQMQDKLGQTFVIDNKPGPPAP
jgi:tripartite-type tricarboxylate transporter receptor subunit TctC